MYWQHLGPWWCLWPSQHTNVMILPKYTTQGFTITLCKMKPPLISIYVNVHHGLSIIRDDHGARIPIPHKSALFARLTLSLASLASHIWVQAGHNRSCYNSFRFIGTEFPFHFLRFEVHSPKLASYWPGVSAHPSVPAAAADFILIKSAPCILQVLPHLNVIHSIISPERRSLQHSRWQQHH